MSARMAATSEAPKNAAAHGGDGGIEFGQRHGQAQHEARLAFAGDREGQVAEVAIQSGAVPDGAADASLPGLRGSRAGRA